MNIIKIFTTLSSFVVPYKRLYIEINDQNIILCILQKKGTALIATSYKEIPLHNNEVVNGNIYNPSFLQKEITSFLKEQALGKIRTIISLPMLEKTTGIKKALSTLQTALCISKNQLKIETIISHSLMQNPQPNQKIQYSANDILHLHNYLLQLHPPHSLHLARWCCIALIGFCSLGFGLAKIHAHITLHTSALHNENAQLQHTLTHLQETAATYRNLQNQKINLSAKITSIQKLTKSSCNPADVLSMIAEKIPSTSWLTGLKIGKQPPSGKKQKPAQNLAKNKTDAQKTIDPKKGTYIPLTIQGITPLINDTTAFIHNLGASPYFKNLSLVGVKKIKRKQSSQQQAKIKQAIFYSFTISGLINEAHVTTS